MSTNTPRLLGCLLAVAAAAGCVEEGPPLAEVSAAAGANPINSNRWYGYGTSDINRVTYYIDSNMSLDHQIALRTAIAAYNRLTALDFQPGPTLPGTWMPDLSDPEPHLIFVDAPGVSATLSYSSLLAAALDPLNNASDAQLFFLYALNVRPASGPRHQDYLIHLKTGKTLDIVPTLDSSVLGSMVPQHEIGHALGLFHEQNRSDRNSSVIVWGGCVDPTRTNAFDLNDPDSETLLSPYDINSMMQYPSDFGCLASSTGSGCACLAVTAIESSDNATTPADLPQLGYVIDEPTGFSAEDLNVLYQVYPPKLGVSDADDEFGYALAAGDFNGDGYSDLAVGVPGESVDGLRAGRVYVYRGTYTGLMPWRKINEPGDHRLDGDRFGHALAAADLDGDGKSELIVGAPRRSRDGGPRTGAVYIYAGNVVGFNVHHWVTAASSGFAASDGGDRFGETLATGDFNGDGQPEIVVGAPSGHMVYVIRRVVSSTEAGDVDLRVYTSFGGERTADDEFGASLAVGDLDNDGRDDLAIGAPGAGIGGRVYFARGTAADGGGFRPIGSIHLVSPASGDRFGEAVEIGRFDPFSDNLAALVVGAPGRANARGRVYVFNSGMPSSAIERSLEEFGTAARPGTRFGKRLLAAQLDMVGGEELVVGMPNESEPFLDQAGLIAIFQGRQHEDQGAKLTALMTTGTPNAHGDAQSGDHFGFALAAGDFDHRPITLSSDTDSASLTFRLINDLAVSTPDRNNSRGNVWVYRGEPLVMPDYPTGDDAKAFNSFLGQGNSSDPGNLSLYRR